MPAWFLVPALRQMLSELNAINPLRSKRSDGTIGDADHRSRQSDHNPDPDGSVDALDPTDDPAAGIDIAVLWEELRIRRDRRVRYAIHDGIWFWGWSGEGRGFVPWRWYPYRGDNPHRSHGHISVEDAYENDTSPWWADAGGLDMDSEAVTAAVLEALRRFGLEADGSNALSRVDASTDLLPELLAALHSLGQRLDALERKLED
jgi:hypothetical protein